MTAKDYLAQAQYLDSRIHSKLMQISRLRDSVLHCTQVLSDAPKAATPNVQSMSNTIAKMVDLEDELRADVARLVDFKAEARRVINNIDNLEQRLLLELRYLCGKPWGAIMTELQCSETKVHRIHVEALSKIQFP